MPRLRPLIFYVEGNLASGKTSLVNKLNKYFKDKEILAYKEPDDIWRSSSLLQDFYKYPEQKAVSFQAFLAATFLIRDIHAKDTDKPIIIFERSLFSASNVFLPLLLDCQYITLNEFLLLKEINNAYIENSLKPDFYIYINTNVETCFYRVRKRNSPGEEEVDYEYLTKIDNLHRSWIKQIPIEQKMIISSSNKDFESLVNRIEAYLSHPDT